MDASLPCSAAVMTSSMMAAPSLMPSPHFPCSQPRTDAYHAVLSGMVHGLAVYVCLYDFLRSIWFCIAMCVLMGQVFPLFWLAFLSCLRIHKLCVGVADCMYL